MYTVFVDYLNTIFLWIMYTIFVDYEHDFLWIVYTIFMDFCGFFSAGFLKPSRSGALLPVPAASPLL